MATRGTPIPFTTRGEIQRLRLDREKMASIARFFNISRPTAYKYAPQKPPKKA